MDDHTRTILRQDAASTLIESIADPITRHLVTNAVFHLFRKHSEGGEQPVCDFDMLYFATLMRDIFSEHDVLRRILAGEKVGAFFPDTVD